MKSFEDGYNYIINHGGAYAAALAGQDVRSYIDTVEVEIDDLIKDLQQFSDSGKAIDFLKGDVAEFWHADTFNIDAALKKSDHRMSVPRRTDLGSPDVKSEFSDEEYGLKYYKTGKDSAKAQARTELEANKGEDGSSIVSIYEGQYRVIPKDQLPEAKEFLNEMIAKESVRRPEQAEHYVETLENLRDRISDGESESIPLSEEEARVLARLAKDNDVDREALSKLIDLEDVERQMYIEAIQDICKAGLTAATISLVLSMAPELYSAIKHLVREGEIDADELKKAGGAAIKGSPEAFLKGCAAAAVKAALKDANPALVGAATVIVIDTFKNAFDVAAGKKSSREMAFDTLKSVYVSGLSMVAGGITQANIQIPVIGYMLGSFVGSAVASLTFDYGYKTAISFSVDSGFTFFGLVKQDYELPQSVLEELGLEVFEYEKVEHDSFQPESFEIESFQHETLEVETLGITYLRRGVIGVSQIGYV